MHNKRLLTIFPRLEPVLLYKDVGALPYYLATMCGWKSTLAYFQSDIDLSKTIFKPNYGEVVTMIPLGVMGGKFKNIIRILGFLASRAKEFDVVNIYHDSLVMLGCAVVYKVLNPSGRVYCKLDMSHLELEIITDNKSKVIPGIKRRARYLLSRIAVDLYSVESTRLKQTLAGDYYFRDRLYYLPNGFTYEYKFDLNQFLTNKENIILSVGRLGSYQKNHELLIDAATLIDEEIIKDWQIFIAGPIDNEGFLHHIDKAIEKHPHLKNIFNVTGNIRDKLQLFDLYKRSKIFCLTSRWESFGFVLAEAMFFANYAISSDLPPSRDMTKEGTIGSLFNSGDARKLAELLADAMTGKVDLSARGKESHHRIRNDFNWRSIVKELDRKLIGMMEG